MAQLRVLMRKGKGLSAWPSSFFFRERIPYSPGWPPVPCVAEDNPDLAIILLLLSIAEVAILLHHGQFMLWLESRTSYKPASPLPVELYVQSIPGKRNSVTNITSSNVITVLCFPTRSTLEFLRVFFFCTLPLSTTRSSQPLKYSIANNGKHIGLAVSLGHARLQHSFSLVTP